MRLDLFAPLALCLVAEISSAASPASLCTADEQVVFACQLKNKKMASLCASKVLNASAGYVQYRFGTPKSVELAYPAQRALPKGHFYISSTMYSGGGASRVRFKNGDAEYFLFDSTIRTNFKAGEPNNPAFEAGIEVKQKGRPASVRYCVNDASNSSVAYEQFEKEAFVDGE
jgi:hypothetical protein